MSTQNRLGGLVQRKGAAPRPTEIPQRGAPAETAQPALVETAQPDPPKDKPKPVSLTLKLNPEQYERLRLYAFGKRQKHQTVIETALMRFLDSEGA